MILDNTQAAKYIMFNLDKIFSFNDQMAIYLLNSILLKSLK